MLIKAHGQLVNFIWEDRYRGYNKARWSTPITTYKKFGDFNLSTKASAMWHYKDKEFSYAEFDVQKVEYTVSILK